ncbi:TPA: hypothetical protein SMF87_004549 [Serratia marcescens]|nr:hypothetical protein [Serratia marcescens]
MIHDYTRPNRRWGHDIHYSLMDQNGHRLRAGGWGEGIEQGDYILLTNGPDTTRYQVESIDYFVDPRDQWSGILAFSPRQGGAA